MTYSDIKKNVLNKKIVGITGGIGSGKSIVADYIRTLGYPVYDSDFAAKEIVNIDQNLKNKIIDLLGTEAYNEAGDYDRKFVSQKVFGNENLLKQLNAIIHPAVKYNFEAWVKEQISEFIFKETALLFELKLNLQCYKSILVTADEEIRIKRVMARDGRSYDEVKSIIQKQMPESDKMKLADIIIENNSDLQSLQKKVTEIFTLL